MSKGKCVYGSGRLAGHFTHRKCLYINIFLIFWIVVIFRIGIKKSPSVQGRQRHTAAILWMFFYSKLIRRAHKVPHFLKGYFYFLQWNSVECPEYLACIRMLNRWTKLICMPLKRVCLSKLCYVFPLNRRQNSRPISHLLYACIYAICLQ